MSELNAAVVIPEVEVAEKAVRRQFSAEYKQKILLEAEACTWEGTIGALLLREGPYSSHLTVWWAARERGAIAGLRTASVTGADGEVLRQYTACIRCAIRVQACADRVSGREERLNPLHLLELVRLASDPRDRAARVLEALSEGMNLCADCHDCDRVCPVGLNVFEMSVGRLRAMLPSAV